MNLYHLLKKGHQKVMILPRIFLQKIKINRKEILSLPIIRFVMISVLNKKRMKWMKMPQHLLILSRANHKMFLRIQQKALKGKEKKGNWEKNLCFKTQKIHNFRKLIDQNNLWRKLKQWIFNNLPFVLLSNKNFLKKFWIYLLKIIFYLM